MEKRCSISVSGTLLLLLLAGGVARAQPATLSARSTGVVVEEVGARSAFEKAGLRPGDALLRWERLPAPPANPQGEEDELGSVFDWYSVVQEQAPRGAVILIGERDGEPRSWTLAWDDWSGRVRPAMAAADLQVYEEGKRLVAQGRWAEGLAGWQRLALSDEVEPSLAVWLSMKIGQAWLQAKEEKNEEAAFQQALARAPSRLIQGYLWRERGGALHAAGLTQQAIEALEKAGELLLAGGSENVAWALAQYSVGAATLNLGDQHRALAALERAREVLGRLAPESQTQMYTLQGLGLIANLQGDFSRARAALEQALAIAGRHDPEGPMVGSLLSDLGTIALYEGKLDLARSYGERALSLLEKKTPDGEEIAAVLSSLGETEIYLHDFVAAQTHLERARRLDDTLEPGGRQTALVTGQLGILAMERGELPGAARLFQDSLARLDRLMPGSDAVASTLSNLGEVYRQEGDFEAAEEQYARSLDLRRTLGPRSVDVGETLAILAELHRQRGELEKAEQLLQQAMELYRESAPDSFQIAGLFPCLIRIAQDRGDFSLAERLVAQGARFESSAGASLAWAETLGAAADLEQSRGALAKARELRTRELTIVQRTVPGSLHEAAALHGLGEVARRSGDRSAARQLLERAREIREAAAPASAETAQTLLALARLARDEGRDVEALDAFRRAAAVLDQQVSHLGGSRETRAEFRAKVVDLYREWGDFLVRQHAWEEAFLVSERARARSFLDLLAERDLLFSGSISPQLSEERLRIVHAIDHTQRQMLDLVPSQAGRLAELTAEQRALHEQYEDVVARIRRASPELAALQNPQPLDFPGARSALDPGTVLLSYALGEERSYLFVVAPGQPLTVKTLPVTAAELRKKVSRFRDLIAEGRPGSALGEARLITLRQAGRGLYDLLIAPAAEQLRSAERILIVPDGPLHLLPWGALVRSGESGGYLAAWKPFHIALSATVYNELRNRDRADLASARTDEGTLVAFGDPVVPAHLRQKDPGASGDVRVRAAARRGFRFEPLPASREEVLQIARLDPRHTRVYLGAEATEDLVKAAAPAARYLHFATHAILDERSPLNSAVVLTIPESVQEGRENGLLQAWEIFDRLRIEADLVVLSACESGLGRELAGEGLIGLTRAFQYAGARSVMASLWQVADEVTGDLMVRFYRHLREGKSKAEALREAQLELIRKPSSRRASAPYYWAAFQLYGDWK